MGEEERIRCVGVLTLVTCLHCTDDATPGIHDAFTQGNDVVKHLVRDIGASSDSGGLLQHLGHNGEVGLKMAANSTSDISEALENGRLELVGKSRALKAENGDALAI